MKYYDIEQASSKLSLQSLRLLRLYSASLLLQLVFNWLERAEVPFTVECEQGEEEEEAGKVD